MANILVLIDIYNERGGASMVAVEAGKYYSTCFDKAYIACNNIVGNRNIADEIVVLDSPLMIRKFLIDNKIDLVHYFQAAHSFTNRNVFSKYIKATKNMPRKIPVLTTVCQQPSAPISVLTPEIIKHTDLLVFIDKTAFNDSNYSFIPQDKKTWMYLFDSNNTCPEDIFAKSDYTQSEYVVFGRGSTLNKIPKDAIKLYDMINTQCPKHFTIIGVPNSKNWVSQAVAGRDDVTLLPILPIERYAEECCKMDIFLYYLSPSAHSSIDGSLLTAMRMGVPVVTYGPKAPQENIIHGVNGFIAENKEDLIKFAELLAQDSQLRKQIGQAGRQMVIENCSGIGWKRKHADLISQLLQSKQSIPVSVPLRAYIFTFCKQMENFILHVNTKVASVLMSFYK